MSGQLARLPRYQATRHNLAARWRTGIWMLAALTSAACHSKAPPAPVEAQAAPSPDRLTGEERLPESETAFGLSLPPGMQLTRHFDDSSYFQGRLDQAAVLVHLKPQLRPGNLELLGRRAVFARTQIKNDDSGRWLRIEVSSEGTGTAIYLRDITPPPALKLSEQEMWTRAGRHPDGTVIDENQQY